jgi:CRISPR/Cas system CSM-associated protein Csm5 (group 7 of RAMP superfamily)
MKYSAEVISPLHIGSGQKKSVGEEHLVCGQEMICVSPVQLLQCFSEEQLEQAETAFGEGGLAKLWELASQLGVETASAVLYRSPYFGEPRQIISCIVGGVGRTPYVPGSSVKGAVRTALTYAMLRVNPQLLARVEQALLRQGRPRRLEFADDCLNAMVWGRDPNHDIGRLFGFGDSEPLSWSAVQIFTSMVLVPRQGDQLQWKILPKGSTTQVDEATALHIEALQEGVQFAGAFTIDERLAGIQSLGWQDFQLQAIRDLPGACNLYSLDLIRSRRTFYTHYGVNALASFYEEAEEQVLEYLTQGSNSFAIPLGWGTGLQSKTIMSLFCAATQAQLGQNYGRRSGDRVHAACGGFVGPDQSDPTKWHCAACPALYLLL